MGVGIEAEDDSVVSVTCSSCQGDDPRLTKVDAEFIVQACNVHEDLLALLQRAAPYIKTVSRNDTGDYSNNDPTLYEDILAAVAKATSPQAPGPR